MTPDEYVGVDDIVASTPLTEGALYTWRHRGVGPRSFKLGRRVVYRRSEVEAWLAKQEQATSRGGES